MVSEANTSAKSEGSIEIENDDDNDDDLPSIDIISKTHRKINQVLTPRKVKLPENEVPSPLTPFAKRPVFSKPGRNNTKFSMSALLEKQSKIEEINKKVDDIVELQEIFHANSHPLEEELDQFEANNDFSQSQEMDLSQDDESEEISTDNPILNKIKSHNRNDFRDVFPGLEIFLRPAITNTSLVKYLNRIITFIIDEAEQCTYNDITNEEFYEYFQALNSPCGSFPQDLCRSLWEIMYVVEDFKIASYAYDLLIEHLKKEESRPEYSWLPHVKDFLEAINALGGDVDILIPGHVSDEILQYDINIESKSKDYSETDIREIRKRFKCKFRNFEYVIKLMSISIQFYPEKYTVKDLNVLLIFTLLISLERLVQLKLWDITMLAGSIIDCYPNDEWMRQVTKVCRMLYVYEIHHHDMAHMINTIPETKRGIEVQHFFAYIFASYIRYEDDSLDENLKFMIIRPIHILSFVKCMVVDAEVDYYQLNSLFKLISASLSITNINVKHKSSLEQVLIHLNRIHGSIKECQGVYINRTKVKAVILGLITKLTFVFNNLKTQCHLDSYFEKSDKELVVEKIGSIEDNQMNTNSERNTDTENETMDINNIQEDII